MLKSDKRLKFMIFFNQRLIGLRNFRRTILCSSYNRYQCTIKDLMANMRIKNTAKPQAIRLIMKKKLNCYKNNKKQKIHLQSIESLNNEIRLKFEQYVNELYEYWNIKTMKYDLWIHNSIVNILVKLENFVCLISYISNLLLLILLLTILLLLRYFPYINSI